MKSSTSKRQLNNAGMTLIELIIVVAIMAVVLGGLVLSTSFLGNSRVKRSYSQLQSAYSSARMESMSKKDPLELKISKDTDGVYYLQLGAEEKQKWLTRPYTVSFKVYQMAGDKETEMSFDSLAATYGDGKSITISFERSGKLKSLSSRARVYLSEIWVDNRPMYLTFETGKYATKKQQ